LDARADRREGCNGNCQLETQESKAQLSGEDEKASSFNEEQEVTEL